MIEHILHLTEFGAVCSGLMLIAFRPAWQEWRHPTDCRPLSIAPDYSVNIDFFAVKFRALALACIEGRSAPDAESFELIPATFKVLDLARLQSPAIAMASIHFDQATECRFPLYVDGNIASSGDDRFAALYAQGAIRLGPRSEITDWAHAERSFSLGTASIAPRRISSATHVDLENECCFERISAPVMRFGRRHKSETRQDSSELAESSFSALEGAVRRTDQLYLFHGDCELPPGRIYRGSVVVNGRLVIGKGTRIIGDIKARKGITAGSHTLIGGSLTCANKIHILDNVQIKGPVISETTVLIGANSTIGVFDLPTTVCADNIVVESGVTAHGVVWARTMGMVWEK